MTCSGESAEVNVSDHKYEVEHNMRNRPEEEGVKKKERDWGYTKKNT